MAPNPAPPTVVDPGPSEPVKRGPLRQASFAELFTPKLATVLREGYALKDLRADAVAGLTVAIVALPLSMAIAIACGLGPDRGLFAAIVGGFVISVCGGSRFQIGGPAGAFIVLVFSIVDRHGYGGLALATMMAGVIMLALGFMRWGTYIKYIPYPVTVGFTSGIAVIIFASQIKELLGLNLAKEPAPLLPKLGASWASIDTMRPAAAMLAVLTIAVIVGLRRWRPLWPGMLYRRRGLFNPDLALPPGRRDHRMRGSAAFREACPRGPCPLSISSRWARSCPTPRRLPCWVRSNCCFPPSSPTG